MNDMRKLMEAVEKLDEASEGLKSALGQLVDAMEADLKSVARSRPGVSDKELLGMARYIMRKVEEEIDWRFKHKVDQLSVDLDDERGE